MKKNREKERKGERDQREKEKEGEKQSKKNERRFRRVSFGQTLNRHLNRDFPTKQNIWAEGATDDRACTKWNKGVMRPGFKCNKAASAICRQRLGGNVLDVMILVNV